MEPQGEFVAPAEPVVTPAQPMESPKRAKKGGKLTKIMCVLFALIAAGLGGYICYDKVTVKNNVAGGGEINSEEQVDGVEKDETSEVISARAADEAKVKKLILELKVVLQKHLDAADERLHYDHVPKVYYHESSVAAIIADGVATSIPETYALGLPDGVLDDNMRNKVLSGALDIDGLFAKELSSRGFVEEKTLYDDLWGIVSYRNNEGIYCDFFDHEELPYRVSCGAESSISDEQKNFVLELAEKYEEKTGKKVGMLTADEDNVEDSKTAGYQILSASHGEGSAWFYRVSQDSEWKYAFDVGQIVLSCDEFKTDELKKAFAGWDCDNGAGLSKVE